MERRSKKKFDTYATYVLESSQPKKKRVKRMVKRSKIDMYLVDEPENVNVGVDMNVEKTPEPSKLV